MTGRNFQFANRLIRPVVQIGFVTAVITSLIIANARERERSFPWPGWKSKPSAVDFGWPFVGVYQRTARNYAAVRLSDVDFPGEEPGANSSATTMPRANRFTTEKLRAFFVATKSCPDINQPFVEVRPLAVSVDLILGVIIVVSSISAAYIWRKGVPLSGWFMWIGCVAAILAHARNFDWNEFFWEGRSISPLDWIDVVCFTVIGAACSCAIHVAAEALRRVRSS